MTNHISYSGKIVREHDPDRFFLSLLMPKYCRPSLWALFAFNYEIAKTREVVSETQLGLIRLQWWRDAIRKFYDDGVALDHEILKELTQAISEYDLPYEHFEALLHAREFDLEDVLPSHIKGMLNYADFTSTPLFKLAVLITGGDAEVEPVQPVAVNYALIGLLRSVPFHARQRRCYLPADILAAQQIREGQIYEGKSLKHQHLKSVVQIICDEFVVGVQSSNKFLRLSQNLANMYAKQLRGCDFDVFSPKMSISPAFKEIRLFGASIFWRS